MDPDIEILRSVAADYDCCGAQYATLAALLRRVAGKLESANTAPVPDPPTVPALCVDSDDGIPGLRCAFGNCEGE
jgi:hypothetical protein